MAPLAEQNGARAEARAMRAQAVALGDYPAASMRRDILYPPPARSGEISGPLYQFSNRALQTGFATRDLGGFSVRSYGIRGQFSHDRLRWLFSADSLDARSRGLLRTDRQTHSISRLTRSDRSGGFHLLRDGLS